MVKMVQLKFLGPETDEMEQFLDQETDRKLLFLGPEVVHQYFCTQKLTKWCNFWPQKLTLWAKESISQQPLTIMGFGGGGGGVVVSNHLPVNGRQYAVQNRVKLIVNLFFYIIYK